MWQIIKNLKPYEMVLGIFAVINTLVILFGAYAWVYGRFIGEWRDIMFVIGTSYSVLPLFLITVILVRKIHLKPKSRVINIIGYIIALPVCVWLWFVAVQSSIALVF